MAYYLSAMDIVSCQLFLNYLTTHRAQNNSRKRSWLTQAFNVVSGLRIHLGMYLAT